MKAFLVIFALLASSTAFACEGKDCEVIADMVEKSKSDLETVVGKDEVESYFPISAELKKSRLYIIWGYNRGFHSDTDTTFHTPDGTFTIHDARGEDRPSSGLGTYLDPSKFTQPQYNLRIGYTITSKWAVEIGTDHMKWIFVPDTGYKITGDYSRGVWVRNKNPDGSWSGDHPITFEEAKQTGNTDFVHFEHSDGYNYINGGVVYTQNIFTTRNNRFSLDIAVSAGGGMLLPKTRVMIRDQADGNWRDVDNKFHVAGWGLHADTRLKFTYRTKGGMEYFVLGSAREVYGKVNNALFLGSSDGSISQDPIYSFQVIVGGGVSVPVFERKKKKRR